MFRIRKNKIVQPPTEKSDLKKKSTFYIHPHGFNTNNEVVNFIDEIVSDENAHLKKSGIKTKFEDWTKKCYFGISFSSNVLKIEFASRPDSNHPFIGDLMIHKFIGNYSISTTAMFFGYLSETEGDTDFNLFDEMGLDSYKDNKKISYKSDKYKCEGNCIYVEIDRNRFIKH